MGLRRFYSIQTATLNANPPAAHYVASICPGNAAWSIVLVHRWNSHEEQDVWEALPSVSEHYLENMGQPAPSSAITAFAPWGTIAGMTLRQVFNVIRQNWPIWRH